MDDCIFCQIMAHKAPAEFVYEDDHVVAFMDIYPATRGHCLIVPRPHVRNLYDVEPDMAVAVMNVAVRLAPALRDVTHADGMNLWQSSESAAGQVVFHFHMHLLPRYAGDGLHVPGNRRRAAPAELNGLATNVRQRLMA
jgi:histidine triad (HIT) family protein